MLLSSSAPNARANFLTALQARPGLAGVQIVPAYPSPETMRPEVIHLAKTVWDEEDFKISGGTKKRERYYFEVLVMVTREGDNAQACENRAWALTAEIEQQLVNPAPGDLTLGGAVNGWASFEIVDHTPGWAEGVRVNIVEARVRVVHNK